MTAISSIYSSTQYVKPVVNIVSDWNVDTDSIIREAKQTSSILYAIGEAGILTTTAGDGIVDQFRPVWKHLKRVGGTDFDFAEWTKRNFSDQAVAWQSEIGYDKEARKSPLVKKVRAALARLAYAGKDLPGTWAEVLKLAKETKGPESDGDRLVRGFRIALGIQTKGDLADVPALIDEAQVPGAMVALGQEGCAVLLQILIRGVGPLEVAAAVAEYQQGTAQ